MVQLLVTVRAAGPRQQQSYQMLECTTQTTVAEIKARALAAAKTEGTVALPAADGSSDDSLESAASAAAQELIFLGQICRDDKTLADYGVSEEWIAQVAGFVMQPRRA